MYSMREIAKAWDHAVNMSPGYVNSWNASRVAGFLKAKLRRIRRAREKKRKLKCVRT
jgi:hypothetical protein